MTTGKPVISVKAVALNRNAYRSYGCVIAADDELSWCPANMGTSRRFNHLASVENLRHDKAKLNLCIFSCTPPKQLPLEVNLLEKHAYSTQVFIPIDAQARFLVIVCLGEGQPDLSTLAAFVAEGAEGISRFPGVWHYPMTALDKTTDFSCLVYENGTRDDCTVHRFEAPILIEV